MPGYKPPNISFWLFHALSTPLNCSGTVSGINLTLPTIYVADCIPSPLRTKYFELFKVLPHPCCKPNANVFVKVPNSPADVAVAVNPVLVPLRVESLGKQPTPLAAHFPNIGAWLTPLS